MVEEFYLYIMVRNDMDSMNPGKAAAQATHAGQQFVYHLKSNKREYRKWAGSRGYGTTSTVVGSEAQIDDALLRAEIDNYNEQGWVIDESYPILDGKVLHHLKCKTCAYIFAPRGYLKSISKMKRMP